MLNTPQCWLLMFLFSKCTRGTMLLCIRGLRSVFIAGWFTPISMLSSFSIVRHLHSFIIFCFWLFRGRPGFFHAPQIATLTVFQGYWFVHWGFLYLIEEQQSNHFSLPSFLRFRLIDLWHWPYQKWINQSETIYQSFIFQIFPSPFPFGWLAALWNPTSESSRPRSAITSLDKLIVIYPSLWFSWGGYC